MEFQTFGAKHEKALYCRERVSLEACLSFREHISETTRLVFTEFLRVTYGPGSVFHWRQCDTLCTSGLMDMTCLHILARNRRREKSSQVKLTHQMAAPNREWSLMSTIS